MQAGQLQRAQQTLALPAVWQVLLQKGIEGAGMVFVHGVAQLVDYHIVYAFIGIQGKKAGKIYAVALGAAAEAGAGGGDAEAGIRAEVKAQGKAAGAGQDICAGALLKVLKLLRRELPFNQPPRGGSATENPVLMGKDKADNGALRAFFRGAQKQSAAFKLHGQSFAVGIYNGVFRQRCIGRRAVLRFFAVNAAGKAHIRRRKALSIHVFYPYCPRARQTAVKGMLFVYFNGFYTLYSISAAKYRKVADFAKTAFFSYNGATKQRLSRPFVADCIKTRTGY